MKKQIKYILSFLFVLAFRFIPFRAPNIEPVMATLMPVGKTNTYLMTFSFGFFSIFIFDMFTSGVGIWTFVTALAYGFIGLGAKYYFKNHSGWKNYAKYALISTIVYDAITGLSIGPLFFGQSFMMALVGQIPFTVLHLIGNISFAIFLSPIVETFMVKDTKSDLCCKEGLVLN